VIGNSRYEREASLPNPRRDSTDVANRFQAYGLQTELVQDARRDAMRRAVDGFAARAKGANLAAVYYAGHGALYDGITYLVPVDGDLGDPANVRNFVAVPFIRRAVKDAAHRLLVFDNCLNNPADGWKQQAAEDMSRGFAALGTAYGEAPNTLALYSTAQGRIALDGPPGENSPFAASFLRQFDGSAVDLTALAPRLRRDLLIATEGKQVSLERNAFTQPFVLGAGSPPAGQPADRAARPADPSRVIELPNAYAFARQNGLPMPAGLVALRPPAGSRDGRKVGAFRFPWGAEPAILVVLSVEDAKSAELVMMSRATGRAWWSFCRGAVSGDSLEFSPNKEGRPIRLRWRDADSGSVGIFPAANEHNGKMFSASFARLDG
jgi:hypothetical protein